MGLAAQHAHGAATPPPPSAFAEEAKAQRAAAGCLKIRLTEREAAGESNPVGRPRPPLPPLAEAGLSWARRAEAEGMLIIKHAPPAQLPFQ